MSKVNHRREPRFAFDRPIPAGFGPYFARVVNISQSGIQLEHRDPLHVGAHSHVLVPLPRHAEMAALSGRIVWSHLSPAVDLEGKYLYRSGIELEAPADTVLIDQVIQTYGGVKIETSEYIVDH